ncbi:sialate O-acetylesterase [Parasediminibacterium sp. JCM 36343]|uniref:sialate O-acetylesterase n=1 Tax=Parasediminibacterium sp. JCM 36343 TaxID=3374279 RepID=UPI00397E51A9
MKKIISSLLLLMLLTHISFGQANPKNIKLPGFFGSNMVLQRDKPIKFWGTASPNTGFAIEFAGKTKTVDAGADGNWQVTFPQQKAGSNVELKIMGDTVTIYTNILMGDVWLTSGQSNMDFSFGNTDSVASDMIENSNIRFVIFPSIISNYPQKDVRKLDWQLCNKQTAISLSAVSYYFAQKINKETGVPIGIISSSWGGTSVKAWTSEQGIANIPEYKALLDTFLRNRYTANAIDSISTKNYAITNNNNKKYFAADKGYIQQWTKGNKGDATWLPVQLPGPQPKEFMGAHWYRKEMELPASVKDGVFFVYYGRIWGISEMYINGVKVAGNNYLRNENKFFLKPNTLVPGKNILVLRVVDADTSTLFQGQASRMVLQNTDPYHQDKFPIAGQWETTTTLTAAEIAKLTTTLEKVAPNTTVSSIFNVKISPLLPLSIKGILWYQGENDAAVGYFYRTIFKNMITDWRQQFGQGSLPFIFAQLPVFGKIKNEPVEDKSEWADLRESQAAALSLPNTSMVVTLELGNPNDIHPHNKKPVGHRMAFAAMKMVYGYKDASLSPLLKSYTIKGNEVHVYFTNTGTGLSIRVGDALKGFAIAGADKAFVWGDAKIVGKDEIVISSPSVSQPVSVRYGWGQSPVDANLANKEGLPASPFRTDDWPVYTQGKVDNKN